jgi:hypothetical protein
MLLPPMMSTGQEAPQPREVGVAPAAHRVGPFELAHAAPLAHVDRFARIGRVHQHQVLALHREARFAREALFDLADLLRMAGAGDEDHLVGLAEGAPGP